MHLSDALACILLAASVAAQPAPVNTPGPMLSPAFSHCQAFYLAGVGQDCTAIIHANGLTREEFFRINPAVGDESHCRDRVIPHTWYCVRGGNIDKVDPGESIDNANPGEGNNNWDAAAALASALATATVEARQNTWVTKMTDVPAEDPLLADLIQMTNVPDEPPPPTTRARPTRTVPIRGDPTLTPGPPPPDWCNWGDCWYEFAQLSFSREEELALASTECEYLFNIDCEDHMTMAFPLKVKKACPNCSFLSSACPCFTASRYHTLTDSPVFQAWFDAWG